MSPVVSFPGGGLPGKPVALGGGDLQSFYNLVVGLPGREAGTTSEGGPRSGGGGRVAEARAQLTTCTSLSLLNVIPTASCLHVGKWAKGELGNLRQRVTL